MTKKFIHCSIICNCNTMFINRKLAKNLMLHLYVEHPHMRRSSNTFLKKDFIYVLERGESRKKETERNIYVREKH